MRASLAICCAIAFGAQIGLESAIRDASTGEKLEVAKLRYYEAVEGKQGALDKSRALLSELHSQTPDDPVVLAYLGSVRLLDAARAFAPWRKGKLAKEGLQMLDEAVGKAPEHLEIRFLRAISSSHLPDFFKRREQSESDFAWLAPRVGPAIAAKRLDKRLGAAALYQRGLALERARDLSGAEAIWREAVRVAPDTRAAADAQKKLDGRLK